MKKSELKKLIKESIFELSEAATPKMDFLYSEGKDLDKLIGSTGPRFQSRVIVDMFRGNGTPSGNLKSFLTFIKQDIKDLESERINGAELTKLTPELREYFTKLVNNGRAVKNIFYRGADQSKMNIIIDFNEDVFAELSQATKKQKIDEIIGIVKKYKKGNFVVSYSPKNLQMAIVKK